MKTTRRKFLETVGKGAIVGGAFTAGLRIKEVEKGSGELPTRPLGKTGFKATILALGGTILPRGEERTAIATVKKCLELGVNYFDTASQYGDGESERRLGLGLKGERQDLLWIATKTLRRSYAESREEIKASLKRLNLKKPLDCIQLHSINDIATLDQVMGGNGSLKAAQEAVKAGLVRKIGITGHTRPEVLVEALKRFPFATALIACGVADQFIGDFAGRFVPFARKQGCGIIAMKVYAEGRLVGKLSLEKMLKFALSQDVDTAVVGMGKPDEVQENFTYLMNFKPLSASDMALISASAKPFGNEDTLWWKRGAK